MCFYFHPTDYSVGAQARKSDHEKKYLCRYLKKIDFKGGLISEDILTLVPLSKKVPNFSPLNKLFTVKGRNSNVLLWGEIWYLLLAMGPKSKYFQRLSYL